MLIKRVKRKFDARTGPDAAIIFDGRKYLHPGRGSTIRKVIKGMRIQAGLRPLCYGPRS